MQMVSTGHINATDMVWTEGQADWQRADTYSWFTHSSAPPIAPPAVAPNTQYIANTLQNAPPSLLVWSILMIFLCGIPGIIGGIIALIKDSNAKTAFGRGDFQASQNAFRSGKRWLIGTLIFDLALIPIAVLIAIPTIYLTNRTAHEVAAKKSLQAIQQAEMIYAQTYPVAGYACSLQYLGADPAQGQLSATNAQLIPADLANGEKDGYIFNIDNCTKLTENDRERVTSYQITAVPVNLGKTGTKGFCMDSDGTMKEDPAGGTNCTIDVQ